MKWITAKPWFLECVLKIMSMTVLSMFSKHDQADFIKYNGLIDNFEAQTLV